MLDGIEALIELDRLGTVSEAAVQLRLTQSAVSKRIRTLETDLGYRLVDAAGRRLKLTSGAQSLIKRARPLLAEIRGLKYLPDESERRRFSIGVSDSIASSWGPNLLASALSKTKHVELDIHVHRSVLIVERLRLGHYELGLVSGASYGSGLVWAPIAEEPMVLIKASPEKSDCPRKVLTIETASATWREIANRSLDHPQLRDADWLFLESFAAAAQMARAGFGQALVPLGTATALGFRASEIILLVPSVSRRVQFVARKSIQNLKPIRAFQEFLATLAGRSAFC